MGPVEIVQEAAPRLARKESRLAHNPLSDSFLQSHEWGEIQRYYGRKIERIVIKGRELLCIQNDLGLGFYYWYIPRPNIVHPTEFLQTIQPLGRGGLFLRLEPLHKIDFGRETVVRGAKNLQPRKTILLNLLKTEADLRATMHPKARYNMGLAERHAVSVEIRTEKEAAEDFYQLLLKTAERDAFSIHPRQYYRALVSLNSNQFSNELFFAHYQGKLAAAAMVNFYNGVATYLHGASSYEHRHIMAPHLLHWRIIEEAKRRGFSCYDLGGVDEVRWPGVTRFKQGFGGSPHVFPPAVDIIQSRGRRLLYVLGRRVARLV